VLSSKDVRRVLSQPKADKTLSLYLQVDPTLIENQSGTPGWRIWLKNALRDLAAQHEGDPDFAELRARADHFALTLRPECKAIAAFFTPGAEQVFRLPVPVTRNELAYGRPAVASLLWLLDEYEPYVVALVDSEKSRFFVARLGRAGLSGTLHTDIHEYDFRQKTLQATNAGEGGYTRGGNNRDAFNATLDDHTRRYYRDVAEQIGVLLEQSGAERVVLGGIEESAAAVRGLMHETVARAVVGYVPVPLHAGDQAALNQLLPAALEFERQQEKRIVDEVIDLARSGGRGALGVPAVLQALANKQVELLIVPWPCRDDDLHAKLPELALSAGARIELVAGPAAEQLEREGGIAARLFYVAAAEPTAAR
jgi:hypothetical protein